MPSDSEMLDRTTWMFATPTSNGVSSRGAFMTIETDEGAVIVPRKVTLTLAIGAVFFIGTQIYVYATDRANTQAQITAVHTWIAEAKGRGDDLRRRIAAIEADRDRLIRVEERLKGLDDRLVEIRDELRRR